MNWREKVLDFDNLTAEREGVHGLVFDIQKFAVHDGGGIRTLVFLKGCPLKCLWCSNPESLVPRPEVIFIPNNCISCGACRDVCSSGALRTGDAGTRVERERCTLCGRCARQCYAGAINIIGRYLTLGDLLAIVERDRKFYDQSNGGVTFSGGEPTAQAQFLTAALAELQKRGIHTAIETSSFLPWEPFQPILRHVDLVLTDVKHMDDGEHRRLTGVSNAMILANLRGVAKSGVPLRVRLPLIPGCNDSPENLTRTAEFVGELETLRSLDILPYHRLGEGKWRQLGIDYALHGRAPHEQADVERVAGFFRERGIPTGIGG
jgi:pyruvate formate lyase activating enzyme